MGNYDYCKNLKGGKSRKRKAAEQFILDGQDLMIITENEFLEMIDLED